MITKFSIKNYKLLYAKTEIDFKLHEENCIGIYGDSDSGKTTILDAILYASRYILYSHDYVKCKDPLCSIYGSDKTIDFEFEFSMTDTEFTTFPGMYRYVVSLGNEEVVSEALYYAPFEEYTLTKSLQPIYIRHGMTVDTINQIFISQPLYENICNVISPTSLVLSTVHLLIVSSLIPLYDDIQKVNFCMGYSRFEAYYKMECSDASYTIEYPIFKSDPNKLTTCAKFISEITNTDINGFVAENNSIYSIYSNGVKIPLNRESKSVKNAFVLYCNMNKTLSTGGILFIDDFDTMFNPKEQAKIINMFLTPESNPKNARLVYTATHVTIDNNTNINYVLIQLKKSKESYIYPYFIKESTI